MGRPRHRLPALRLSATLSAAWGLALLLAGCLPESDHPLTPPDHGIAAPELLGLWVMPDDDGALYVHVLQRPANRLQIVSISHDADGSGSVDHHMAHVAAVGGRRFASLREGDDTMPEAGPYAIFDYTVENGTLTVRFLSPETLAEAIDAGRLAGIVEADSFGKDVRLTGSGAEIASFLGDADPATLFDQTMVFGRVPVGGAP